MEEEGELRADIAAILATLVAHEARKKASQVVGRNERDTSNWKLMARWQRMGPA
jgi:hypothetical protein